MHSKNVSPVGWYVASYVERFEFDDEDHADIERRCRAWQNTIIIKASNPEEAYQKALTQATLTKDTEWTRDQAKGRLIFEGFTSLLPIYDELEDGAELFWKDFPNSKIKTVKSWIKEKADLEAFSDPNAAEQDAAANP
jgi:hypothetical protein